MAPPHSFSQVIAMVLDSPFLGVKQVVTDGIEKFQGNGEACMCVFLVVLVVVYDAGQASIQLI